MIDYVELCDSVLNRVPDNLEAQAMVRGTRKALTRFANSFIHQNVAEDTRVVVLHVADEGRTAKVTTSGAESGDLDGLVERAVEAVRHSPVDEEWTGFAPAMAVDAADHHDESTAHADPDARAAVVDDFISAGSGMSAAGYCDTTEEIRAVSNHLGLRYQGAATSAILDGIHRTASSAGKAHRASARLAALDGANAGAEAAAIASAAIDPVDVEPGSYEVVLRPNCSATVAAFVGLYAFGGKAASEGRTQAVVGSPQFDEKISLRDDVFDSGSLGIPLDWEGQPKRRVDLIRSGVSEGFVHDRRTALRMGVESTGHDWRFSEWFGPAPTSLVLGEGDRSEAEMIASVSRGLLVTEFNYCRILDPTTLYVTGLTRNGTFLIEDGRVTRPVSNLRFTQSFFESFGPGNVVAVGNDARLADSEYGPRMVNAPTMQLASWNFTGGAKG